MFGVHHTGRLTGSRRSRSAVGLAAVFGLVLGVAGIAHADNLAAEGDTAIAGQAVVLLGNNVCAGDASTGAVSLLIRRQGSYGGPNAFRASGNVAVSVVSATAGLSASVDPISIPANWGTVNSGLEAASPSAVVTLNTTNLGPYSGTIEFRASGLRAAEETILTRDVTIGVSATVVDCTPANTAPSVTVDGVGDGATYNKASVPAATCEVTDAEDGPSSFAAALSAITGPYTADGIGSQTASCSYTDTGGLNASASATYSIVDPSAPAITYVLNPAAPDGNNGWYRSDVTLTWTVSDPESPNSLQTTGCDNQSITADQVEATYSCSATSAGGSAGPVSVLIKRDATAPTITGTRTPAANANGWNNGNVTVSFECDDALSGVASCTNAQVVTTEGANQSVTGNATDNAGNTASATVAGIGIDKTAPTITGTRTPAANPNGWNNGNVTVSFECDDALSGIASCTADQVLSDEGTDQSVTGNAVDRAGNTASTTVEDIDIDKTPPTVSLVGGPVDGGVYYFGSVPASPGCSASDALSGLDGVCTVSGYSNAVGSRSLTASATDLAGNTATATSSYTVLAWNLTGFYQPVDMSGVWNTVKGGSTVPLKFEVFAGSELTTTDAIGATFAVRRVACSSGTGEDPIEMVTTGGTSLRYDATGGQFIQNWKTPTGAGVCYSVSVTTADGSSLTALFKTK